ncbi:hypothetical protein [Virgibacillus sp. YIM 98842]|uniref:hypothetical protein n=1 Tax=Virgibacillus sp. YIM 98842 TaxID=2663533 RepID=UPI0013DCA7F1|nr:hypothetical protein [Virgibacillus sp. YIM 98842]
MEEISSYKIKLNRKLETKDIIKIHELALKSNFSIYVYRESSIADAENLPKLLSFFFFASKNHSLVMIIDGQHAEKGYHQIKSLLRNTIKGEWRVTHKIQSDISVAI